MCPATVFVKELNGLNSKIMYEKIFAINIFPTHSL